MEVITISGYAGSGKDTAGLMIAESLKNQGKRVLITHYADLVKYICKNFFGWNGQKDENGRDLLQFVGTDVVRARDSDYWVNFIIDILSFFEWQWDWVIIPDLRFPNELERLREKGFHVTHLRITRPNLSSNLTDGQKMHISETALDGIEPDFYINNDGNISQLKVTLQRWIKENVNGK